jgi:hypothetical protein
MCAGPVLADSPTFDATEHELGRRRVLDFDVVNDETSGRL